MRGLARVAKLVDAPGLGPDAVEAYRFESGLAHQNFRHASQNGSVPFCFLGRRPSAAPWKMWREQRGIVSKAEARE